MALDPVTIDVLRVRRQTQLAHQTQAETAWQTAQHDWQGNFREDLVFTEADGTLISPDRYTRWFRKHLVVAGLPQIRMTCATPMQPQGWP
jgi:hypothetical protein